MITLLVLLPFILTLLSFVKYIILSNNNITKDLITDITSNNQNIKIITKKCEFIECNSSDVIIYNDCIVVDEQFITFDEIETVLIKD